MPRTTEVPGRLRRRARKAARDKGFVFEAPLRTRMHYDYCGIWVGRNQEGETRWWLNRDKAWVADYRDDDRWKTGGASNKAPCRTLRAFRSHLRRHRDELKGLEVVLCSRFVGHNVTVQL